jgi:hypothetical protein
MGLAKISKDIRGDIDKYIKEQKDNKKVTYKQKQGRLAKAEKREQRHGKVRQGIKDMLHE